MQTLDNRHFWRTIYRFNSTFYSGLDVRLFVGERWLDIATALEFTVNEMVVPIYGYKSYTFDTVLRGIRTIQGNLAIHFVRPFYLFELIDSHQMEQLQQEEETTPGDFEPTLIGSEYTPPVSSDTRRHYIDMYMNRTSLVSRYWSSNDEPLPEYDYSTTISAPMFGTVLPIHLVIVYSDPVGRESESNRFVVDTSYVASPSELSQPNRSITTRYIEVLSDIEFTGVSRAIDDSGHSLLEVYSFIAHSYNDEDYIRRYYRLIQGR